MTKETSSITCPFCNEIGFDKIGLKYHLIIYCKEYTKTDISLLLSI